MPIQKKEKQTQEPCSSLLAGERVRVAYQLCKHVQADLANTEIQFQKGQLLQLRDATQELASQLGKVVGE